MPTVEYRYLRAEKAEVLHSCHANSKFSRMTKLDSLCVKNGIVLPIRKCEGMMHGLGGVLDDQGNYIEESGIPDRVFGGKFEYSQKLDKSENTSRQFVYCGPFIVHWGHFLMESAARCWYALQHDNEVEKYVFSFSEGYKTTWRDLQGNFKEFFSYLGILQKIVFVHEPMPFSNLIIPQLGYCRDSYYSTEYLAIFDYVATKALSFAEAKRKEEDSKGVYFSRSHFEKAKKTEFGLEMVDSFFKNNGFDVISPENISLRDMIQYLNNSKTCAFPSGTAAHNILFSSANNKVIILERQPCPNEYQTNIDIMKNLDVTYIDSYYTIKFAPIGDGPFLLAWNNYLQKFASDGNCLPPDSKYIKERRIKRCIRQYLKSYYLMHGYTLGIEKWQVRHSDVIFEAYFDSLKEMRKYLSPNYPLFAFDIPPIMKRQFKQVFAAICSRARNIARPIRAIMISKNAR